MQQRCSLKKSSASVQKQVELSKFKSDIPDCQEMNKCNQCKFVLEIKTTAGQTKPFLSQRKAAVRRRDEFSARIFYLYRANNTDYTMAGITVFPLNFFYLLHLFRDSSVPDRVDRWTFLNVPKDPFITPRSQKIKQIVF